LVEAWRVGFLWNFLPYFLGWIGMDLGGAVVSGDAVGGRESGAPDTHVPNSLGLEDLNLEGLNLSLTYGVFLGTHTLPTLSFSGGLTFGSSATTMSGFVSGLDPLPGLLVGVFECIGLEPGALFNAGFWDSQQKVLAVDNSGAHFSPSGFIIE
jgi:hypothetical protein